ncbi:hypothetical protein G6F40_016263 [Rhizopus arrhizus]|nr:hypothetical protein G6F40_016263 [Rhizopus arrhizus]
MRGGTERARRAGRLRRTRAGAGLGTPGTAGRAVPEDRARPPPGGADRAAGAHRQFRARHARPHRQDRPHLHPHRRRRRSGGWTLDLHDGNGRGGRRPVGQPA